MGVENATNAQAKASGQRWRSLSRTVSEVRFTQSLERHIPVLVIKIFVVFPVFMLSRIHAVETTTKYTNTKAERRLELANASSPEGDRLEFRLCLMADIGFLSCVSCSSDFMMIDNID